MLVPSELDRKWIRTPAPLMPGPMPEMPSIFQVEIGSSIRSTVNAYKRAVETNDKEEEHSAQFAIAKAPIGFSYALSSIGNLAVKGVSYIQVTSTGVTTAGVKIAGVIFSSLIGIFGAIYSLIEAGVETLAAKRCLSFFHQLKESKKAENEQLDELVKTFHLKNPEGALSPKDQKMRAKLERRIGARWTAELIKQVNSNHSIDASKIVQTIKLVALKKAIAHIIGALLLTLIAALFIVGILLNPTMILVALFCLSTTLVFLRHFIMKLWAEAEGNLFSIDLSRAMPEWIIRLKNFAAHFANIFNLVILHAIAKGSRFKDRLVPSFTVPLAKKLS